MKFEAIIFDWSGTLSDDRRPVYEANKKMCDYWNVPSQPFDEWSKGASMTPIEFFRDRGVTATGDEIYELYRRFFRESLEEGIKPQMFPDAYETMQNLSQQQIPTGVVSAHPTVFLQQEAQEYLLHDFFSLIHGDARDKIIALTEVCTILNVAPEQSLYVGDTIYDIRSARAAGLITAGITTGYHSHEALEAEKPHHLFTNLSEIIKLVNV